MPHATPLDRLRQGLVLLFAVAQVVAGYWLQTSGLGEPVGVRSDEARTAFTPADFAFSIWGPIFLLLGVYAIAQVRPSAGADPFHRAVGWFAAAAFLGNAAWITVTTFWGTDWRNLAILILIASTAIAAFLTAQRRAAGADAKTWLVRIAPFGLFAGWTLAAAFANLGQAAFPQDFSAQPNLAVMVAAAAAATAALIAARGALIFAAPIVWAFAAVWAAGLEPSVAATALVAAAFVAAWAVGLKAFLGQKETPRT